VAMGRELEWSSTGQYATTHSPLPVEIGHNA
jgi:hypothetical protein